jgi:hypothetical protein
VTGSPDETPHLSVYPEAASAGARIPDDPPSPAPAGTSDEEGRDALDR